MIYEIIIERRNTLYYAEVTVNEQLYCSPYRGGFTNALRGLIDLVREKTGVNLLASELTIQLVQDTGPRRIGRPPGSKNRPK